MRLEGLYTIRQAREAIQRERDLVPQMTYSLLLDNLSGRTGMFEVHIHRDADEVPDYHLIVSGVHVVHVDRAAEHMVAQQRIEFETAMFELYSRRGWLTDPEGGDGTPEALFWREDSGMYGVKQFNAAWYGWLAARGLEAP